MPTARRSREGAAPGNRNDRYPLSPGLKPFKSVLAKLDPRLVPKARLERPPLPEAPVGSRGGRRTRR